MHSYLRQALMRHCNEFFTMSEEEQTRFKLQEHDELDKKIKKFIKKKMGIKGKTKDADLFEYNKIILPWDGIGPNSFMLNEFTWNEKILEFKNLYEANEANHNFQEEACTEDFTGYEAKPLYNRFNDWARTFIDGKFYYANVSSWQIWMYYALDNHSFEWFEKNIPHDYVSGPDDGKEVDGGYLWDMELDANGKEGYYNHMSEFSRNWISEYYEGLDNNQWDKVFIIPGENDDPTDPTIDFIFGSMNVLKNITFENFVEDCYDNRGGCAQLLQAKHLALEAFEHAMNDEFEKIQKKPSKEYEREKAEKRKVVMAHGALDGLEE